MFFTEFLASEASDVGSVSSRESIPDSAEQSSPAPAGTFGPLAPRGTFRQVFLTVWRGANDSEPSTFVFDPSMCRTAVGQRERCPDTQRIHEHWWLVFTRSVRPATFERLFVPRIQSGPGGDYHGEAVWGTNEQVYRYTTKVASRIAGPWEFGERLVQLSGDGGLRSGGAERRGHQGRRTDLEKAKGIYRAWC